MLQLSPNLAREDLSVEELIYLIENAPPGPWPNGWASWANVNEAHRVTARRFADNLRPSRHAYAEERGIVIAGGGLKYFPGVWVGVNLICQFGGTLPIQLWYLGDSECDPYMKRLLRPLGVECVEARNRRSGRFAGWSGWCRGPTARSPSSPAST